MAHFSIATNNTVLNVRKKFGAGRCDVLRHDEKFATDRQDGRTF